MMKVNLDIDQYNKLAYNAVNYACGRSSYIVGVVLRIIRDNMDYLDYTTIDEIIKLIVNRNYGFQEATDVIHSDEWRSLVRDLLDHYSNSIPMVVGEVNFQDPDDLRLLILTSFRSNLYFSDNGIVPDYLKVFKECSEYMNKDWFRVFDNDINEAKYYGVDLAPYCEVIGFIYNVGRKYA